MPETPDSFVHGWPRRWTLAALFACCLLPFLIPLRTLPLPGFYAEWVALATGLAAIPVLAMRSSLRVPRVAMLPAGLFVLLLLQLLWLPVGLRPTALIGLLYLFWTTLLMLATAALLHEISLPKLAGWLALALFLAALLNALKALPVQALFGWPFPPAEAGANLGQVNLFADLLWLGVVSLLYRWQSAGRHGWLWATALLPLLFASALTGGRAPMLYALWLILAAFVWGEARLKRAAVGTALLYFLIVAFVYWLALQQGTAYAALAQHPDSLTRTLTDVQAGADGNVRLDLMAMAGSIFFAHPLFGAGWGSYPWASYSGAGHLGSAQAAAEHAHQFFFHLAAEMGMVGLVLALTAISLWMWPLWRDRLSLRGRPECWWAVTGAGVVLLHSQLEFPLWSAHFLGICAILMTCAERCFMTCDRLRLSAATLALTGAAGAYFLFGSGRDYVRLEQWIAHDMHRTGVQPSGDYYRVLVELSQDSMLKAQAMRVLAAVMPPTAEHLEDKLGICRYVLPSEPQAPAVFTCALLKGLAGDVASADRDMHQASLVFGKFLPEYLDKLNVTLTPAERQALEPMLQHRD